MTGYNNKNIVKNLTWKFTEKIGIQLVNLIIQIILTRVLLPEDYANVALIMVFVQLANLIVQSGLGSALVQKKNVDTRDFSTVFYLCVAFAIFLYILLYIFSPTIARFYDLDMLSELLRVQAVILFPCAINTVQIAYLSRNMEFSKNFIASIVACIMSGIAGILAAYMGLGIWAIVICNVTNQIVLTVVLWFTVKWRPTIEFSVTSLKEMFHFGWKLLISSVMNMFYGNIQTLVIGKIFSSKMLGYYNRGELMGTTVMSAVNNAISSVMLPVLSKYQDNIDAFKVLYRRILTLDCFFSFPIMFGLASVAQPLIVILFTEKWLPAVPFMMMICISRAFDPVHVTNLEAILALGRSDITLRLEIIKKGLGVTLMLITYKMGIFVFVGSNILLAILSTIINAYPNIKAFNYSLKEQLKDILPCLALSVIMFILTYSITMTDLNEWIMIAIQIVLGVTVYVAGCLIFKIQTFKYVWNYIKKVRLGK